jgi:superfamily II DNA or RNA helicase
MNRRFYHNKNVSANSKTSVKPSTVPKKQEPPKKSLESIFLVSEEYKQKIRENSYIGQQGYTILKTHCDPNDLSFLKKDLMLEPQKSFGATSFQKESSFPVFRENANKIYLPRFYGIERYGVPTRYDLPKGDDIHVPFVKPIREYQENIIQVYLNHVQQNAVNRGGGILEVPCGRGKCLGKNTPILMYDGNIKLVQDVIVGDLLMGDDSTPRTVLSLARGQEQMYAILSETGDYYIVNESHILSLKNTTNTVLDITVADYLKLQDSDKQDWYGYRVPISFNKEYSVDIDPYWLGYWLNYNDTINNTIFQHFIKTDSFINDLDKFDFSKQKYIPHCYKCNTREIQTKLLMGMIDANPTAIQNNTIEIIQKNERLVDDIIFVARSLGFSTSKILIWESETPIPIYKIMIHGIRIQSGNMIDVYPQKFKLENAFGGGGASNLNYKIQVLKLDVDDYYGFEIDGNRRFVLGDFTVTHNTVMALKIISLLQKKTLILVHKEFLMNQWIERINEFIPSARIGKIQGPTFDIDNKDIVIGMIQSLYDKPFAGNAFSSFGLTIIDEVHRIGSEEFSKTLFKTVTNYMLGISATVERKDGLTKLLYMFIGPKIYSEERKDEDVVEVRAIQYSHPDEKYNTIEYDYMGNVMHSSMVSKISQFPARSAFIIQILRDLRTESPDNQIIVLSQTRALLNVLHEQLIHSEGSETEITGFYVGGMKPKDLTESESRPIVLATYAMAAEALDIKSLNTLVMISPKTDIIQSVGRILRTRSSKKLVVDIVDTHDVFQNQWKKRRTYYKKCGYGIRFIKSNDYKDMTNIGTWKRLAEPVNLSNPDTCETGKMQQNEDDLSDDEELDIKKRVCLIPLMSFDS